MCRLLDVSSTGYYEWRTRYMSNRIVVDAELQSAIARSHARRSHRYGQPGIHAELCANGIAIKVACADARALFAQHGTIASMSRRGECCANPSLRASSE